MQQVKRKKNRKNRKKKIETRWTRQGERIKSKNRKVWKEIVERKMKIGTLSKVATSKVEKSEWKKEEFFKG